MDHKHKDTNELISSSNEVNTDHDNTQHKFDIIVNDEIIGYGNNSEVYSGYINDDKRIAVKAVDKSEFNGISNLNEIDIMSKLRHPNIMSAIRIITSNDSLNSNLIIMDIAENSLYKYIKQHRKTTLDKISIVEKTSLLLDVCRGLSFLHDNNILHMDLKMDNILICNGRAKLCDFGNSVYVHDDLKSDIYNKKYISVHEYTTPNYRAPEIINVPYIYSPKSDIWALGLIILYTLIEKLFNLSSSTDEQSAIIISELFGVGFTSRLQEYFSEIEYMDGFIDLIPRILTIDPKLRISLNAIMIHPVFSTISENINTNNIQLIQPKLTHIDNYNINQSKGFKTLVKTALMFDSYCETVFLSTDIYHRSLFMCEKLFSNNVIDPHVDKSTLYDYLAVISYWMASKIITNVSINVETVLDILNNELTINDIILAEEKIVEAFQGIIYRTNYFNSSQCQHELITAFNHITKILTNQFTDISTKQILSSCSQHDECYSIYHLKFKDIY